MYNNYPLRGDFMEFKSHFDADNIYYLEEKIFRDSNRETSLFNYFKDIDISQIERIYNLSNNFLNNNRGDIRSKNYVNLLKYLSTPFGKDRIVRTREEIYNAIPTYDEYLAFIITGCDPDCELFKTYISADNSLSNNEKINLARKKVGFFSKRFLLAEKYYFFKYKNELLIDVRVDKSKFIGNAYEYIDSFDKVTLEKFDDISKKALLFRYATNDESRLTTCLYDIIYQPNLLDLNSIDERIVFLIAAIDPELKLLTIYEEECRTEFIKKRALEEVGFYDKSLIDFERKYKDRFMPDKKLSSWSL